MPMRSAKAPSVSSCGSRDLGHQPELGDAQPAALHAFLEEVRDPPGRQSAGPPGTRRRWRSARRGPVSFPGLAESALAIGCMYVHHLYLQGKTIMLQAPSLSYGIAKARARLPA